jgi:uncharacterized protein YlxW (UPF0749 family)
MTLPFPVGEFDGQNIGALRGIWSTWSRAILLTAIVAPAALLVGQCQGKSAERARQANAERTQLERERTADSNLNQVKQKQEATIAANRKEVDDAVAHIPDQAPSARQRARACLELRRQGAAPAACGPAAAS